MTTNDLPLCRHLVKEAGWNQIDDDWMRAMELEPAACFVAEIDNIPVATTTACCFGNTAWIAMVLVDKKVREQGIGKHLVEHAIEYLERQSIETIRLDATSMGQGLYKKLGFREEYEVIRYWGNTVLNKYRPAGLYQAAVNDVIIKDLIKLDKEVTGTDRKSFIDILMRANASPFYCKINKDGKIVGYAGSREGTTAVQIGPAIALTSASGRQVLNAVASHFQGKKTYIDIPAQNKSALIWAQTSGFTEQRRFIRMYRGHKIEDLPQLMWASSGPEKG